MSVTSILICLFCMIAFGNSIPPSLCFEPFNYEDCGRRPLHVLYYYKPGSRCEVAIWRGCPTRNMFKDEYECINTCIMMERAKPEDYHNFGMEDDYQMPLDYGEVNDTMEELEGTTDAGGNATGTDDGEGATESGGSEKGTGAGEPDSDKAAATDGGADSGKDTATDAGADTAAEAGPDAPDAPPPDAPPPDEPPPEEPPAEET